ncbi:MAG: RloB family protein [Flavobacterium sp.]
MQRRKYSLNDYNKKDAFEDATKIFIIYEGTDKEPNYFQAFNESFLDAKKAYVHHILDGEAGVVGNMPENLKQRVISFLEEPPKDIKVTPTKEDKFRFVLDVDKHPAEQITALKEYSDSFVDSALYISNYCFEVWLWFHLSEQDEIKGTKCREIKTSLGQKQNDLGIASYPHSYMAIDMISEAIKRAEVADIDKGNYFPVEKSSKVYLLMQELLQYSLENNEVEDPEIL